MPYPFVLARKHIYELIGSDPDTMRLHEAMKEPDRLQFLAAMQKEIEDHVLHKHWKLIPLHSLHPNKRPLPMVCSMKRKRNPLGEITEWMARLCAGGHKSIENVNYWATYSPVVSWSTVRLILVLALINNWTMRSIDFVMAFPQADTKTDLYMKPPTVPSNFVIPYLPKLMDRFTHV